MFVRIVTFSLDGIDAEQYLRHAESVAEGFNRWDGLLGKVWLADPTGTRGGIYLFTDRAAADASRTTPLFRSMADSPAFDELTIEEFEVIAPLTAITAGSLFASHVATTSSGPRVGAANAPS
ncbi:MAG: YdhR family protein [Actinobacteria bacterium]|nr:YdhR family protein [Actinomycetota bacterium]